LHASHLCAAPFLAGMTRRPRGGTSAVLGICSDSIAAVAETVWRSHGAVTVCRWYW
jgi:hypothetical protein